ncbi:MAG: SusC/RagA family TonB-linked outer membrane protein, partial [Cyclobacteriaceae bacterium]|nr:SusC/RagA family TonB-linked outer membrane protein [Cyclobacteriaceae bacterium HetDA_MAG_MS6]
MKSNFTIILFCALLIPFATIGQERKVSGTVTDLETGEVLPGVTIQIEGTSTGTITDSDGNYSLTVSEDDALVFSFIGYQTTKVGLQGRTVIDIGLNLDIAELGEVVVTGYSVERKRDQLGAVAVVKAKDLADLSNPNVINNIQGRVPGVFVDLAGDPGQGANVRIRGNSTLGNNAPLYIVDGVPVQPFTTNENGSSNIEWGLAWLNPNDIETIQVLKDASSASIYGSRASNGVVIITTKQPTKQEPQVTLSVRTSVDNWNQREQLTNNRQRAIVEFWGAVNDGADPNATGVYNYVWRLDPSLGPGVQGTGVPVLEEIIYPEWLDEADQMRPAGFGGNIEEGTDWWDEVAQTAVVQNYDVSFSHGGENGGIHFSFNHFNQEGVVINTGYKRTGARLNSNYNFFEKRLTVGQNLSISKGERRWMDAGFGGTPEQGAFRIKSIIPVRTEDGRFAGPPGAGFSDRDNPVALAHDNRDDRIHNLKVLGNLYADLEIVEGLNFRTSFGIDYDNIFTRDMFRTYSRGFLSNSVAELTQRQTHLINWVANNTLTYSKAFGNHSITAFVGTEAVKNEVTITAASGREFALETPEGFQLEAAQGERSSDGSSTGFSLFSYFGKVSYALNDKYLASVTVRRDGSSRFGRNDQFAVFPAVQLGWRIGDEPFLSGARWLSDLKLRYAWGQAGNQDIQNEARF